MSGEEESAGRIVSELEQLSKRRCRCGAPAAGSVRPIGKAVLTMPAETFLCLACARAERTPTASRGKEAAR